MPLFKGRAGKAKPKKAIDYVTDPKKAVIISSLSMDDNADYTKQFSETCKLYGKGSGYDERKYYHFKLSPDRADNSTPQQCHELAERMARELFSAHECVIATHNDTDTIHSHIIVNAVSFETGKKFHMNVGAYRDSKDLADILGAEMGFTPLDWKTKTAEKLDRIFADEEITPDKKHMTHAEKQIAKRDKTGNASWKEALRQAIDEAKAHCTNRAEFQRYLQDHFGVTMPRNTGKTVSFIHPAVGEAYAVRGNKLGGGYTAAAIDYELQINLERSLENARLLIDEEQPSAAKAATPTAIADPIPNIPIIISQSAVKDRNRKRLAPRSVSDVGAELRNLDETVDRIANRVSKASAGGNNDMATEPHEHEQFHETEVGGNVSNDRAAQPSQSNVDKPPQPTSLQPVIENREHERSVQQKPKRRSYERG
jgi:hypothetical protein